jgi:hypothetical protein
MAVSPKFNASEEPIVTGRKHLAAVDVAAVAEAR